MTDIPIPFTGPMIQALLDGRKTMTRRLPMVRRQHALSFGAGSDRHRAVTTEIPWQNVRPGDRLWACESIGRAGSRIRYEADGTLLDQGWSDAWKQDPRAAAHLPRQLSRLTLVVRQIRIERLQDVSEADARAEGFRHVDDDAGGFWIVPGTRVDRWRGDAVDAFEQLWCSLRGRREWEANPEVVEMTFEVRRANIDAAQGGVRDH